MISLLNLLVLTISLELSPSSAKQWPESPLLRTNRGMLEGDASTPSSSGTLYEEFVSLFYESMDTSTTTKKEHEDEITSNRNASSHHTSDFLHQLENLSQTASFKSTLSISRGDSKGAFYYVQWSVTSPDLGCAPVVKPNIKLNCSNGGRIHVDQPCIITGVDAALCIHGYSISNSAHDFVGVWCSGNDETELGLKVELVGGDATCRSSDGVISQGISLGQGCGAFESKEFRINVKESFCDDHDQFVPAQTTDENPLCMSTVAASEENLLVSVPAIRVSASVSSSEDDSACIYDINA